jgi:hypothetical protein
MNILQMILSKHRKPRINDGKRVIIPQARIEPKVKTEPKRIAQPEKFPLPEYYQIVIEGHKAKKYLFNYN